jgi:long-chain acyl-CoA synthetase
MTRNQDLSSLFRAAAAKSPDAPAVLTDARCWNYRALDDASDGVAAGLAGLGIAPGDRVALYCPNGAEFVVCYLGILKRGAVVVPVNLLLNPAAIAFMLEDCGVTALCLHAALAEPAAAACASAPSLRLRVGIGFDGDGDVDAHVGRMTAAVAPAVSVAAADDAVILYTSGTTGRPKGAVLTHANLAANARAVAQVLAMRPGSDRVLVVLPMFHAFAGTVGILTPLLCGAALVPVARFDPQAITDAIGDHAATVFLGVPSLYAVLLRLDDAAVARWRSVRQCISGGAAMPAAVMEGFEQRFGVPVLEGDGPTECGPVTCVNPPAGPRKPGSVGPPLPGVEMRIADDAGRTLPDGEHGEVCVRGPSVMRGYWHLPDETAASFHADPNGDWFRTGDLGWRDADGWFYLVDRIKDLVITNGMNVYPRVVEEALVRHPAVAEAAVVGEPHRVHGEIVVAHVTLLPDAGIESAALKDWCRKRLGRHEVPRRVEIVESLPKNAAGKVLKRELRRAGEVARGVDAADGG